MPLFLFFVFGLFLGSFLNTAALRLKDGKPFIFSRSKCPYCGKILKWYNLIPVLSFLVQKGKCSNCHKKISLQYPFYEILTGLFTYGLAKSIGIPHAFEPSILISFSYYLVFISCFFILALIDLKTKYIDERILYFLAIFWIVSQLLFLKIPFLNNSSNGIMAKGQILTRAWSGFFNDFLPFSHPGILGHIFLGLVSSLAFVFLFLITLGKGVGLGDAKIAFVMGLFLNAGDLVLSFLLTIILGGIAGIFVLIKNRKFKQEIPYVPFLFLGTLITIFWGEKIISYYFKIF